MDRDLARLMNSRRKCRCCGASFAQLLSLEYDRPDPCPPDLPKLDNSALLMERGDVLTEDFCRVDDYRFLRSVLVLQLGDGPNEMVLGVWCAVSIDHFDAYVDLFDGQETTDLGSIPGWLSSAVPPGSEIPMSCVLHMQPDDQRPEVEITERGNELKMLQETGLDLMDLLQILHDYGHDLASLVHDS
ncbi:DUF2199 domain-containing protein [Aliisedimentitalea scapharcae]|uniref:DUF2199 domain-containing protein n=1 Tax=Aliisedimentitalea scapharcae TaxID=1524259 RepID=A0ABZ2XR00_9RHOB|nr:DUF2199 domain-containing protein [Rhodobacteraceae bacterium M382]